MFRMVGNLQMVDGTMRFGGVEIVSHYILLNLWRSHGLPYTVTYPTMRSFIEDVLTWNLEPDLDEIAQYLETHNG